MQLSPLLRAVCLRRFATGPTLFQSDALIQEFYSKESSTSVSAAMEGLTCAAPVQAEQRAPLNKHPACLQVHLLVDTTLEGNKFTVQAFTSRQLSIKDKALATEFVEVPSEVLYADIERVGGERGSERGGERPGPVSRVQLVERPARRMGLVACGSMGTRMHVDTTARNGPKPIQCRYSYG